MLTVYTDGAYAPTKDVGAIAFIVINSDNKIVCMYSKKYTHTTNQRMEQLAVIKALESIPKSDIIIYSDSAYVVNTYNLNWNRKQNLDLWQKLDKAISKHDKVQFIHVKGHNKDKYNEYANYLAQLETEYED